MGWREGCLRKAGMMREMSKMYNWLLQFLFQRTFIVQVGSSQSSAFTAENGIPQGSVISPIPVQALVQDVHYTQMIAPYGIGFKTV